MLKESIIFVMLILFSIEDIRKRRIDVLPLLVFLVIGILYQAITRSLTIPEICGGAFLGVCLLGIAKVLRLWRWAALFGYRYLYRRVG